MNGKPKKHGLEPPFHLYQYISWLYIVFCCLNFYLFLMPFITVIMLDTYNAIYDISMFFVICFGIIATRIDPTDPLVKATKENSPL